MGDIVKVSWSGGKDSTCATMLHIERGDKVKAVCYIPMFTDSIPLIRKNHYEFILKTADKFRSMGAEVYIVKGMSYWDFVLKKTTRGKNKGKIFGFPCYITGKCNFRTYSKGYALDNVNIGDFDYEDIGIASDEIKRQKQLNRLKRSILCEEGYTEKDATMFCQIKGIYSPHYEDDIRDGCSLCPHASKRRRELWFQDYPEAKHLLIMLQDIVKEKRPDRPPLRNKQYFIETDVIQLSIFD